MATIKEIAQITNCSPSTVSIVLSGKACERNISDATQQKVWDAAKRLGYHTNIAARSLRGGIGADELQIAMIWAQDFRAIMMIRFWDGMRQAVENENTDIRLVIIPYVNGHLKEVRALTHASDCHAAIICNASEEDLEFLENTKLSIPVVLYNRFCPGYCSVNVDDSMIGALAARALISQNCENAAIVTGEAVFKGMDIRIQGFILEGRLHNLDVSGVYRCGNSTRDGYAVTKRQLLESWSNQLPDGIFCSSTMIAHGMLRAFAEEGFDKRALPKIIAVGNGIEDQDRHSVPSLSVVDIPMENMAKKCLSLILGLLSGETESSTSIMLETSYIPRETCGPI